MARAVIKVYMFHGRQFRLSVMSPFFCPHDLYEDITLDAVQPPFHPPMYPIDEEIDSDMHLTPTYSIESDPSEPSYPSMIQLMSDSSPSTESWVHEPRRKRSFMYLGDTLRMKASTWWYTRRVWEWLRSFLRLDGRVCRSACQAWIVSVALFYYTVLGLHIYGMYDSWRLILYISFF